MANRGGKRSKSGPKPEYGENKVRVVGYVATSTRDNMNKEAKAKKITIGKMLDKKYGDKDVKRSK